MNILLCGLMGSGKSYEAVNYHIIPALKRGRKVITNIPLQIDYICAVHGDHIKDLIVVLEPTIDENDNVTNIPFSDFEHFKDDWRHEKYNFGALFVIDEAQIPLPSVGNIDFNKKILAYATMQRHRGHDWILITQEPSLIYAPLLKLTTATHSFKKRTNIGDTKSYRHFVLDGYNPKCDLVLTKQVKKYDKSKFKYYKSHTDSDGAVQEENITGSFLNIRRILIILGLCALGLLMYIGWIFMYYFPNRHKKLDIQTDQSVSVQQSNKLNNANSKYTVDDDYIEDDINQSDHKPIKKTKQKIEYKNENDLTKSTEKLVVSDVDVTYYNRDTVVSIESFKKAPYDGFYFNIIGSIVNPKLKKSDNYYQVWSSDGVLQNISKSTLQKQGYDITILDSCTHIFDHKFLEKPYYVTCHAPRFEEKKEKLKKNNPNNSMINETSTQIANKVTH